MIKNYFKTAWRNMMKRKAFSFINILGLTIGITVCLLIFLFIINEFSVNDFHKQSKNIYQVMRDVKKEGGDKSIGYLSGPYAPALLNDFKGQVIMATRVNQNDNLISVNDRSFHEKKVIDTDKEFFEIFSFPFLKGNPHTALERTESIVLSETTAKKYFGNIDDAMGKVVTLDKNKPLTVTGIIKDVPSNSSLDFDIVIPLENYKEASWMTNWVNNGVYTFILINKNISETQLEKQLPTFMKKYMGENMRKYGYNFGLSLTPLQSIYFNEHALDGLKHGSEMVVYIFLSIAVLILIIACINFINLSTISATERSKEVGLRKVLGAERNSLVWQFLGESVLITCISCILSLGLLFLVMPAYSRLLGHSVNINWTSPSFYLFFIVVIVVAGFLAGSYPALVLSGFKPIQALKSKLKIGGGGSVFRNALVVFQFTVSVFLITGTIIITRQLNYIKNKQLGYKKEQTLLIPIDNYDIFKNLKVFKDGLQSANNIASVSAMSGVPGGFFDGQSFDVEGHDEHWISRTEYADFEFVKTLGLKIIAGRDFLPSLPTDTTDAVLINRTAAAKLGWTPDQAINKWIKNTQRDDHRRKIVGVVEDFNFLSLKEEMDALVISPSIDRRAILVRFQLGGNMEQNVKLVQSEYKKVAGAYPFEYSFLDQQFNDLYKNDLRQQKLLTIFAGMAIFVACLGLLGLASFSTRKRFKEIGVRKVLGSSVQHIVLLLSKDLMKPIMIATCIALPLGFWVMNIWLENFAYKTDLSWWIFALSGASALSVALFTVAFQATKAAIVNPIKSLRTE